MRGQQILTHNDKQDLLRTFQNESYHCLYAQPSMLLIDDCQDFQDWRNNRNSRSNDVPVKEATPPLLCLNRAAAVNLLS